MTVIKDTGAAGARCRPSPRSTRSCARRSAASSRKEIAPHVDEWEEAREFPRELYSRCGELGFLGLKYPEEYGGQGGDSPARRGLGRGARRAPAARGGVAAGLSAHA